MFGRKRAGAPGTTTTAAGNTHTHNDTGHHKGGMGPAKLLAPLLLALFIVQLCFCSSVMDRFIEGESSAAILLLPVFFTMVLLTLIASCVGASAMLLGLMPHRTYSDGVKHANLAAAFVTFGLLALAFGFSCKSLEIGVPGGNDTSFGRQMNTINALNIINLFFTMCYLALLAMSRAHTDHTAATTHTHGAPLVTTGKTVDSPIVGPTHTGGYGNADTVGRSGTTAAPATTVPTTGHTHTRGLDAA